MRRMELIYPAIHVWRADLPADADYRMSLLLDAGERERAKTFHFERDRTRFMLRCTMRREVLADYAGTSPETIQLGQNKYGKPALSNNAELRFNLSKSKDRVLLAVAQKREVGIDIEAMRPMPDAMQVAQGIFSSHERDILQSQSGAEREKYFFRIWARKEAAIKALGLGLSAELQEIDLAEPTAPTFDWTQTKCGANDPLYWRDLDCGDEFAGALAVFKEPGAVEYFDWKP